MNDNIHSLLGPYLVGAVLPDERAAFESHLADCDDCSDELRSLAEVTAVLADAEAVSPPASLRARVMAEAARTAQLPPVSDSAHHYTPDNTHDNDTAPVDNAAPVNSPAAVNAPAAVDNAEPLSGSEPISGPEPIRGAGPITDLSVARARRARRRNRIVGLAAASVLVLGAAGIGISTQNSREQHQLALVSEKEMMMVTTAPDAHSMDLDLGASHLVMSAKMDGVVAMGQEAPMPSKGMEYQLWLMMDDGSPMPGPTFMPEDNGEFVTMMHTSFDDVAGIMITQEPMGGSTVPTSAALTEVHL